MNKPEQSGCPMSKTEPAVPWPVERDKPLDPPPEYAELRKCPVIPRVSLWNGQEAWLFTRYNDIRTVLRDPDVSADSSAEEFPSPNEAMAAARKVQRSFARMDPPQHDLHRLMLAKDFMVSRIATYRPYLEGLVDRLLDDMEKSQKPVDLVTAFAEPLPAHVICYLLDLPETDSDFFQERVATWMSTVVPPEVAAQAAKDIIIYFEQLIDKREKNMGDDIVSKLIADQVASGALSKSELTWILHLLLVGGYDTTANMISLGTVTFLENPEQLADLLAHPELVDSAVEELLRYLTVAHFTAFRMAKKDITVGGQCIHAGDGIIAPLSVANRDPEKFADPDKFDIRRDARGHLAFGFGVHQCLGQPLARLELQIVFSKLFQRFPTLRLAIPHDKVPYKNSMIYGIESLPVTW